MKNWRASFEEIIMVHLESNAIKPPILNQTCKVNGELLCKILKYKILVRLPFLLIIEVKIYDV